MSLTTADQAAERAAERWLEAPEGAATLARVQRGLRDGLWDTEYQANLAQPHRGMTIGQTFAFARINALVQNGGLATARIEVGSGPLGDGARAENAELLAGIHEAFTADLDMSQKTADQDGHISWREPIEMSVLSSGLGRRAVKVGPAHGVPLEVGCCNPARIFFHLMQYGAIARWGYDSDVILLLVGTPDRHAWLEEHNAVWQFTASDVLPRLSATGA